MPATRAEPAKLGCGPRRDRPAPARAEGGAIDVNAVAARVRQWLLEGRDVRIVAVPRGVPEFPMVEMWDDDEIEVLTGRGAIHEARASRG